MQKIIINLPWKYYIGDSGRIFVAHMSHIAANITQKYTAHTSSRNIGFFSIKSDKY